MALSIAKRQRGVRALSAHTRRNYFVNHIKDTLFIVAGVLMATFGLKGFLLPNRFLDGGAMGVSLLLDLTTPLDLWYLIILVNVPFILMGARQISTEFAVKSTLAIIALAVCVHYFEFPSVTSDKLLIAAFGGFFLGAGIGFTIRGGAVIDGTEVLAIQISRNSSLTVGDFITIFNTILFLIAILVVPVETAMYSMLTYLAASKTIDFIINGVEEYIGVMVVSRKAPEVKQQIVNELGRGVTAFKSVGGNGEGGIHTDDGMVLFCVVTRLEVTKLLLEITNADPDAFVVQYPIKDTKGGMIKKRPLH